MRLMFKWKFSSIHYADYRVMGIDVHNYGEQNSSAAQAIRNGQNAPVRVHGEAGTIACRTAVSTHRSKQIAQLVTINSRSGSAMEAIAAYTPCRTPFFG